LGTLSKEVVFPDWVQTFWGRRNTANRRNNMVSSVLANYSKTSDRLAVALPFVLGTDLERGMNLVRHLKFSHSLLAVYLVGPVMVTQANSEARAATQTEIVQNCESCHGARGDSKVSTTPRLNGQQPTYIVERLKNLSAMTKSPHTKVGMFKELAQRDSATVKSIANYFSSQAPTPSRPGPHAAEGQQIFEHGSRAENVIGCSQCHGPRGEGHNIAPRLSGQHADYLMAQLQLFNLKFRKHVLMNPNTKTIRRDTMEALTSYLAND
jgi:cytochrome c553